MKQNDRTRAASLFIRLGYLQAVDAFLTISVVVVCVRMVVKIVKAIRSTD